MSLLTRRELLRTGLRLAALGGLGAAAWRAGRRGETAGRQVCTYAGSCRDCRSRSGCGHPAGLTAAAVLDKPGRGTASP